MIISKIKKEKTIEKTPDLGPIEMVVLQGTSFCNLNCSYCYLTEESRKQTASMSLATIERVATQILSSDLVNKKLRFSWHSGEPMVLKPEYYQQAMQTILNLNREINGANVHVDFDIQTNGTRIDQNWCDLILESEGLLTLGVSCDGPAELHNHYRRTWSNQESHTATEKGMLLLVKNDIKFDVTAVISRESFSNPESFLQYFSRFNEHIRELHYNLHDEFFIEDAQSEEVDRYIDDYSVFLQKLLAVISSPASAHLPKVRNFTSFYNRLFVEEKLRPDYSVRAMSKPFKTLSIEVNGDTTTFYAGLTKDECGDLQNIYNDNKGFVIGNLLEETLDEMSHCTKLRKITADFETSHNACEKGCDFFELCSGGYNLIKFRRFGRFDVTETPECRVHVKTFANTLLNDINSSV